MSDYRVNEAQELNPKMLGEIIEKHRRYEVPRLVELYDLYKGNHQILDRQMSDENKPNNKLVNDFYGKIIDNIIGYFLGKPIVVNIFDERIQEELDYIFKDNDIDDLFMEVGKECAIKGKSNILVYQDEESETKLVRVPAEEVIYIKDNNEEILNAIRVYEGQGIDGVIRYAEIYDREKITYYVEAEGKNRGESTWMLDNSVGINPKPHIYERVPLIPVINNEEEMGDYEKVISLVDAYDKLLSDTSNEHEAYRNAYLMLKNLAIDTNEIFKFKETGVIEVMDEGDVKFITKDIQDGAINSHLERLRSNIFDFANVPPLTDENFAGNLSGVAIKFKLFGLENKCITKERKMNRAIRMLLKVLNTVFKIKTGRQADVRDIEIMFTRSIPTNVVEITDVVTKLNGIVDKETLIGLLPFIDNPALTLEKLEEENEVYGEFTSDREVKDKVNELLGEE